MRQNPRTPSQLSDRDIWRSVCPTPARPPRVGPGPCPCEFWRSPGRRLHNSGQPMLVLRLPHSTERLPYGQRKPPVFQFTSIASCPDTGQHRKVSKLFLDFIAHLQNLSNLCFSPHLIQFRKQTLLRGWFMLCVITLLTVVQFVDIEAVNVAPSDLNQWRCAVMPVQGIIFCVHRQIWWCSSMSGREYILLKREVPKCLLNLSKVSLWEGSW